MDKELEKLVIEFLNTCTCVIGSSKPYKKVVKKRQEAPTPEEERINHLWWMANKFKSKLKRINSDGKKIR